MDNRKIILSSFTVVGFILWFLARSSIAALRVEWYAFRRLPGIEWIQEGLPLLVGVVTFAILYLHPRVNAFLDDVVVELKKVTWPSRDDVRKSTTVVDFLKIGRAHV